MTDPAPARAFAAALRCSPRCLRVATAALIAVAGAAWLGQPLAGHRSPPAFLARDLGPPGTAPASVTLVPGGMAIAAAGGHLGLDAAGAGTAPWQGFAHGGSRRTPFGTETVTISPRDVEEFLVVDHSQGARTWQWRLRFGDLVPRVGADGTVGFLAGHRLTGTSIKPVAILDRAGRDITPRGLRWSVVHRDDGWWLELRLDDAALPTPYTIDPGIVFHGTPSASDTSIFSQTSLDLNVPTGYAVNDLFIAQLSVRGGTGTTITPPAGWTLIRRDNAGTNLAQAIYYHVAASGEPSAYTFQFTSNRAAGGIIGYTGVDDSSPIEAQSGANDNTGTSSAVAATAITTGAANEELVDFSAARGFATFTPPTGLSEEWDDTGGLGPSIEAADVKQVSAGSSGTETATASAGNFWVAQLVALRTDTTAPTNALTATSTSPPGSAYVSGSTLYYRGTGGGSGGSFQLTNTVADSGSGPASSSFPALGGTTTGWTHTTETASTPAGGPFATSNAFTWTEGTTSSPTDAVSSTDNAGNTSSTTTLTFTNDSTNPTGSLTAPASSATVSGAAVTVSSNSADGGSGVASAVFQSSPAGAGTWSTIGTDVTSPYSVSWDTTAIAAGLYDVRVVTTDRVGNTITSALSTNVNVTDVTAPTNSISLSSVSPAGAAYQSGNTIYYRGTGGGSGGNFQLQNAVSDVGSGAASSAFPALGGVTTNWTHTTQTVSTPSGGPYVSTNAFTWAEGASASPTEAVQGADVAANTRTTTLTFTNDSTNPTGSITAPASNAKISGAAYAVTSNSADGGSGVASVVFQRSPAGAATWTTIGTDTSTPFSVPWDTTAVSEGLYDVRAVTTDNVGNTFTSATISNVLIDNTAPTGSLTAPAASSYQTGTITISSDSADGGSGVASAAFQRAASGGSTWTTINTDSTAPYSYSWDTTTVTDGVYDLRVLTTDNSGNSTASATVASVTIDNTDPTVALTATSISPAGSAFKSGNTVYYRGTGGGSGGSFQVTDTVTDATSGAASSIFPALGGTTTGWSHTNETITTPSGGPYVSSSAFTWTEGASSSPTEAVTATDNAGNTSAATTLTFTNDSTAPTGSMTNPASSAIVSNSVTVSANSADTGGSGVASVVFQRAAAGGNTWTTISTDTTSPYSKSWDTTLVTDGLYDLRAVTTDNVGNTFTSPTISSVRVDNSNPSNVLTITSASPAGSAFKSGNTVYYRGTGGGSGGSFQVQNALTDGGSGPASATFPSLGGTTTGWSHTNETISTPSSGPYVSTSAFTWTEGASSSPTEVVTGTDVAGNTNTGTTLTFTNDSTNPTGSLSAPASSANLRGSVTVSSNSLDTGGSGVLNATYQRSVAGANSWTTIASDTTSPYSISWDTTGVADGLYDLRVITTDNVGNTFTSASVTNVRVDNTGPTNVLSLSSLSPSGSAFLNGTTLYYRGTGGGAGGHFQITNAETDAGSGPTSSAFPALGGTTTGWTHTTQTISTPAGGPYVSTNQWTWAEGASSSPTETITGTDVAGNTTATVLTYTNDSTNPTGAVTAPAASGIVAGSAVTVSSNSADAGSGVGSAQFQRSPAGANSWTTIATDTSSPYSVSWDTTGVSDGLYDLRVITTDNVGNTFTSATISNVRVDNTNPTGSLTAPAASANVTGSAVTVSSNSADGGSGVASAAFQYSAAGAGSWSAIATDTSSPYSVSWDTTGLSDGLYDLRVVTTDNAGNTFTSATVANVRVDNTAPTGSVTAPSASANVRGSSVAVSSDSADGGSGVASAQFQRSPHGAGTWTTIATDTTSPYSVSWDTTAVADGLYDLRVITTDNVGFTTTSATVANVRVDNTNPTGSLTAPAASANVRGAAVTVSSDSADGGSDVASAAFQRSAAGAGSWTTIATDTTSPYSVSWDTTGLSDGLYDLRVITTDNAGNTFTSGTVSNVRVDNTNPVNGISLNSIAPVGSSYLSGTTVYYRGTGGGGGGSFQIQNAVTDGGSGPASSAFPALGGTTTGWTHTNETIASPAGGPYVSTSAFAWSEGASSSPTEAVQGADAAGGTATTTLTFTNDSTNPTGSVTAPTANANVAGAAVTVSSNSSDGGAGVASALFQRSPSGAGSWTTIATDTSSPYAVTWDTTGLADGLYDLRVVTTDNVGNSAASAAATVRVDNTSPADSLALSSVSPAGSAFKAGNTVYYRGTGGGSGGSFQVTDTVTDAGSGAASATFPALAGTTTGWTHGNQTITTPAGGPYASTSAFAWSEGASSAPTETVTSADAAANASAGTTLTFTNDSTNPTGSVTAPAASSSVGGAAVTVSSDSADGGAGVASATFQRSPHGAATWTTIAADTSSPYAVSWDTTGLSDGLYDLRVITTDNVGNTGTSATVANVRVDNGNPTGLVTAPAASSSVGGAAVTVSSDSADSGAGVASALFQYSAAGANSWSAIATDTSSPYAVSWDTTGLSDGLYDLRVVTTDNVGNAATSATVANVRVDNTNPTGSVTAPAASSSVGGAAVTVSSDSADSGAGVASALFQYSAAGANSWSAIATDTSSPYAVSWDTTGLSDGLYDLRAVTTDNVGNSATSATVANVRVDNTNPTGSVTAPAASSSVGGAAVTVSSDSADGGSGVASATFQRSPHGAGTWTTIATDTSSPYAVSWDTTGLSDGLYDVRVVTTDNVGNSATSATVANVRVDNTDPTGSVTAPAASSSVGGAAVTVSSDSADGGSGVASALFQYSAAGANSWSAIATDTSSPYSVAWDTTGLSDGLYDIRVVTTDNVGNTTTSATVANVRVDDANPTGSVTAPSASSSVGGAAVTVSSDSADGGSGVASATFQRSPHGAGTWTTIATDTSSPYAVSWDTTGLSDGLYDLRVITTDNVGNAGTSATVANVRVDNTDPTGSVTAPGASSSVGGAAVPVSSNSADAGSGVFSAAFQYSVAGANSWSTIAADTSSPYTVSWDTTGLSDGLYDLRVVTTDNVGNSATSATVANVRVDNTNPTGSVTAPAAASNVTGTSVTVSSDSADAGSGVASATFQRSPHGAGTWTTIATDTTSPYAVSWDTTGVSDGLYDLRVITTDNVGNAATSATVANLRVDNTNPTGSVTAPAASSSVGGAAVTVSSDSADAGSGVASATFQRSPHGAGTWTTIATDTSSPYAVTWDTTGLADGLYDLQVVTTDNVGNTGTSATVADVRVDNTNPTGSVTAPAASSSVGGAAVTVSSNSADAGSSVASALFQYSAAGANSWSAIATDTSSPYSVAWDTTGVPDGLYDLRVVTTDNVGNTATSATVANVRVDNSNPTGSVTAPSAAANVTGAAVTVSSDSADAGSGVLSAAFQYSAAGANSWSAIATDTSSPYSVSWDTTGLSDGLYDLRVITTDNVGNTATSATVANVRVDNTNPTGSVTAPTASSNVRGAAVTVSSDSVDAGSGVASAVFQRSPHSAGTWTTIGTDTTSPYAVSWDTTGLSDGLYDLRVVTTDNVGNSATSATVGSVRIDNTNPVNAVSLSSVSPAGSAILSGTTIFYRGTGGGSGGSFQISDAVSDAGSGPASATFPVLGGTTTGWTHSAQTISTPAGGPYVSANSFAWAEGTSSSPTEAVQGADGAGGTTTTTLTLTDDSAAPTGSVTAPSAAANLRGAAVSVSSDSADAASGVASAAFQRSPHGAGTWTTIATDTTSPYSVNWDTTGVSEGQYDLRVVTTDNVGNSFASAAVAVRVDNTAPANALSLTSVSPAGSVFLSGSTVFYRGTGGGSGGSFQISDAVSDAGSGPASATFPALGGTTTGWSHSGETIATPAGGPYASTSAFAWTEGSSSAPTEAVTSLDAAGNASAATTVTFTNDSANPTGSLTAPSAAAIVRGAAVTVSSNSADGGSGVAAAAFQRSPAGAGTWTTIATDASSPYSISWDTTGVGDGLYDLRVVTTDNVGNTATSATVANVRVDNTAPANAVALSSVSPAGSAFKSGGTVYYRGTGGGAGGSFQLTDTVTDSGSGAASATFPGLGGTTTGWSHTGETISTPAGGPYASTSAFTWSEGTSSSPTETITSADTAGNTSAATTITLTNDSTAPTGSITTPAANASVRGAATIVSSDSADGGSGVASATFQRSPTGAGTWTTIAVDSSNPYSVTWNTTLVSDGLYDLRVVTTDNVGNTFTSASVTIRVDNTNPTTTAVGLTSVSPAGSAFKSGGTIFYRGTGGGTGGSFELSATASDNGSGPASATFPVLGGATTGWSHAGETVSSPPGGPYVSTNAFTWSEGASTAPTEAVTSADAAGNSSAATTLTFTNDSTNPTGALTAPASSATVSGPAVGLTSDSADGGSGVASAAFQYSDAGANTWVTIATDTTAPYGVNWDTNGVPSGLYDLRVVTTDNVGNSFASTAATNILVDNSIPTNQLSLASVTPAGSAFLSDTTVFYRGTGGGAGGSFQIVNAVSAAGSAPVSSAFPALGATTTGWTHTGETITTPTGGPYTSSAFTWAEGTSSAPTEAVQGANQASNTATTNLTFTDDSTNPTGELTAPGSGDAVTGSAVTVSSDSADGGSGIASVHLQYSPAGANGWVTIATLTTPPFTTAWDTTGLGDGLYDLRAVTTDQVGNVHVSSTVANVLVDNTDPTGEVTAPAVGAAVGGAAVPVTSDAADAGSGVVSADFQVSDAGADTWSSIGTATMAPFGVAWDTTGLPDGLYDLRVVTTDAVGNQFTSATVTNILVDNTAPTGAVTSPAPGATVAGSGVLVTSDSDDFGGSGVATADFQVSSHGANSWSSVGSDSVAPFAVAWDSTADVDGLYDLRVVTTDLAGNATTSPTVANIRVDNSGPVGSVMAPAAGASVTGTTNVSADSTDAGAGMASVTFQRSPAGAATWTTIATDTTAPFAASWDTTGVSDGLYDLRALSTDGVGNVSTSATVANVRVDNTAPTGAVTAPAASASVGGPSVTVSSDSADAGSGVASAAFQYSPAGADSWTTIATDTSAAYAVSWDTTGIGDGLYDLRVVTTDAVGIASTSATVANVRVDNTAPTGSVTAPGGGVNVGGAAVTVSSDSADAGSGVASATFQRSPHGAGSWTTIATDTTAPYAISWDTTAVSDGLYDLRVITTDAVGNATTSGSVSSVRVDNTAPASSITAPGGGSSVRGASVTVSSNSTDAGSGVASAAFQYSVAGAGSWTPIATDSTPPYAVPWDTTAISDGLYDLRVITTDAVGNTTTSATVQNVRVDNTAPTGSVTAPAAGASVGGAVTVASDAADTGGSGVASVAFQRSVHGAATWVGIGTDTTAPYSVDWDSTGVVDGAYDLRTVTTDTAGNAATSAVVSNVLVDNTAPAGSITAPATDAVVAGAAVAVTSDSSDPGGSGVASATFQSSAAGANSWSNIAIDATAPYGVDWDTTALTDGLYDLRVVTTDAAGNAVTSAVATGILVDNTAPTGALTAPAAGSVLAGTTMLTSDSADAGSGVATADFQRSVAGMDSWTSIASDGSAPYGADWDTTGVTDGLYDLRVVTTDVAGNPHTSALVTAVLVDNTAPTGSVTAPAPAASVSGTVSVTSDSADSGSGVASAAFAYSPAGAGSWTTIGVATGSPYQVDWDTTSLSDGAYDLQVITTDTAGNTATSATVSGVLVDNTVPSVTVSNPVDGGIVGDAVTLAASATDDGAGIASVLFEVSPAGQDTWSAAGTDTSAPFAVAWDTTGVADGLYDVRATATDGAGNASTSPAVVNVLVDNTAPTGSVTMPVDDAVVSGDSAPLQAAASDGGSGVASVTFQRSPAGQNTWATLGTDSSAPYSVAWDTTNDDDGLYDVRALITDVVGNQSVTTVVTNVLVDNTPPTGSITAPAAGANLLGTVSVTAAAGDSGAGVASVDIQRSPAGAGTWTTIGSDSSAPYSVDWDTTTEADGAYDLQAVITDAAGNATVSPLVAGVVVDNTAPTGSVTAPGAGAAVGGTVTVTGNPADDGSGIAGVAFERSLAGQDTWAAIGSASAAPWQVAWDTTGEADGLYDLRMITTDRAGNATTSDPVAAVLVDNTAPTGSVTSPAAGAAIRGLVVVNGDAADDGAGVASVEFQRSPAGDDTWTTIDTDTSSPYTAHWDTTLAADGPYDLRVVVTDATGNATISASVSGVIVDNTAPTGSLTAPVAGAHVRQTVTLTGDASDAGSGVASVAFQWTTAGGNSWTTIGTDTTAPYTADWDTTLLTEAPYDLREVITDIAGNQRFASTVAGVVIDNDTPVFALDAPGSIVNAADSDPFSLQASATDTDITSIAFAVCDDASADCATGSWTPLGTATGPFTASWSLPPADGNRAVQAIATDSAGNTGEIVRNVLIDRTAPAGGSIDYADGFAVAPIAISVDPGSDAGAGLDLGSAVLERDDAPLAAGTCGSFAASWSAVTAPDGTVAGAHCYRYRYRVSDLAGNEVVYTSPNVVRIDGAPPLASLDDPGSPVADVVSLQADASDPVSGIDHVDFQVSPAGADSWATIATDGSAPYLADWDTTSLTDGLYDLRVVAIDVASNSTVSASVTGVLVDNTAPTGDVTAPADGATVSGSAVGLAADSADAGSGVAAVKFEWSPSGAGDWTMIASVTNAPYALDWDSTSVADGDYDLRVVTVDAAGNRHTSGSVTVTVDNSAPATPTLQFGSFTNTSSTGSTAYYRPGADGTFTVTATASDPQSGVAAYTFPDAPDGWSETGSGDHRHYSYTGTPAAVGSGLDVTATNGVGLVSDPATFSIVADDSAPVSSITCNGNACGAGWYGGSTAVAIDASDDASGAAEIIYTTDGSDPSTGNGTVYTGTFTVSADVTVRYRAYDAVGNEEVVRSQHIKVDATPPTTSVTAPTAGASVSGAHVAVAGNATDAGGSGVARAEFRFSPSGLGIWTRIGTASVAPYRVTWNVTGLSAGLYDVDVVATDSAGNTTTSAIVTVRVAAAAPPPLTLVVKAATAKAKGANATLTLPVGVSAASKVVVILKKGKKAVTKWTVSIRAGSTTLKLKIKKKKLKRGNYTLFVTATSGRRQTTRQITLKIKKKL